MTGGYGCIGERLPHSFSKDVHERIGEYAYSLWELAPEALPAFMEKRDFRAINVTIPYKQAVIPFLDRIDDTAREIGAVNTIVNRNGRLYGYNTDLYGISALIRRAGISLHGKKTLILGTGGTSRTASAAAKRLGAAEIYRVSRTGQEGALTYEEACTLHADAGILINTTPCGMYPEIFASPVEPSRFPALSGVVDAVYNPLRTQLCLAAAAAGVPAANGLYMLVAQAVRAYEIFTGKTARESLAETICGAIRREKENVVLIGMPGSGKSTVGRLLAAKTGKSFVDTDALVEEAAGKPISRIFGSEGEAAFRALETRAIRALAPRTGLVIATGGGAVLRAENVNALRANGRLFWLDRPPALLIPTADRPLAANAAAIEARYREREAVYRAAADLRVPNSGTPEAAVNRIWEETAI